MARPRETEDRLLPPRRKGTLGLVSTWGLLSVAGLHPRLLLPSSSQGSQGSVVSPTFTGVCCLHAHSHWPTRKEGGPSPPPTELTHGLAALTPVFMLLPGGRGRLCTGRTRTTQQEGLVPTGQSAYNRLGQGWDPGSCRAVPKRRQVGWQTREGHRCRHPGGTQQDQRAGATAQDR